MFTENIKHRSIQISSSAMSHEGAVYGVNEDSYLEKPEGGLWAVADGVGGHHLAKTASLVVVESLKSLSYKSLRQSNSCEKIKEKLSEANSYLYQLGKNQLSGIVGSTAVVLYLYEGQYYIFWAGDSRCYLYRNKKLQLLTKDHSQFEQQIQAGVEFDRYAIANKLSNILSRAVGAQSQLEIDMVSGSIENNDIFWLCSDGGLKTLLEKEVELMIDSQVPLDQVNDSILHSSLQRKVGDNITSILVSTKLC